MFMRHLCEPSNDTNQATFADGVPREGLSRQQVLTRIGIMSLIRKKIQEFESINGHWSMSEMQNANATANVTEASETSSTSKPAKEEEKVVDVESQAAETSITEMLAEAAGESNKKVTKDEDEEMEKSESVKQEVSTAAADLSKKIDDTNKENNLTSNPITALKSTNKIKYAKPDKPEKLNSFKFMFNIADGGFTELHTLWLNEQRTVIAGKEYET